MVNVIMQYSLVERGVYMSVCPRLEINKQKLVDNTRYLVEMAKEDGIDVAGVTKVFCGEKDIAQAYVEGGVKYLADSRVENLMKLSDFDVEKILLRLPMMSEAEKVVKYSDISLNSEINIIKALDEACERLNKTHKVIMMVDLGDLREGVWKTDAVDFAGEILKFKNISLTGIGVNLTCYGGVIPNEINLGELVSIAEEIEGKYDMKFDIISGGNSSSLDLLMKKGTLGKINNLRLGEVLVLGRETAYGNAVDSTHQDAFQLVAEIIEMKDKPTVPIGEIGMDAFGNKPSFEDKGIRKRAILGVGRQDVNIDNLIPLDSNVSIIGASSDHLMLDITDSEENYDIGMQVRFNLEYGALLSLSTSNYITKEFI